MAQTIPILITVSLAVPRLSLFSSQSAWWYSDYQYTHHSLTGGTQTIPILISLPVDTHTILVFITAALVVLGLSLYSSQSLWWSSIPNHITFCFVVLRVSLYRIASQSTYWLRQSLYSSQSTWWLRQSLYSSQSSSWYPDYPLTHPVCLVVLALSLYSSQSPWWYSEYPFTHRNLLGLCQTFLILITVSLVVLRLSLYSSSLPCGTQTIPLHITVFLVVLRVSLYSSKSPWWNSDYTYTHHRLRRGTQTISILITVSLVVLRLSLYSSQSA